MVVNVFSEVVEPVLADGRHKPSGELVRPKIQRRGPIGSASPGGNPDHHEAHAKRTLRTVDTTCSVFASFN
jgi:hypothetical protein